MKRNYWLYPDSNLIVERYYNVVNKEHFDALDGSLFSQLDKSLELLAIVDMSGATLFNIQYGEISSLFKGFISRLGGKEVNIKVAIFCGENSRDDYLKLSTFTKYETEAIRIQCFTEWLPMFNWLNLENKLRDNIRAELMP